MNVPFTEALADLLHHFDAFFILSENCKEYLAETLIERSFPEQHVLLHPENICYRLYFVQQGKLMSYYHHLGDETMARLFQEGDLCLSARSFFRQTPSNEGIRTLTECVVFGMGQVELADIQRKFPEFTFLLVAYLKKFLFDTEECLWAFRTLSPRGRFKWLADNYPGLLEIIPDQYLADYIELPVAHLKREKNRK